MNFKERLIMGGFLIAAAITVMVLVIVLFIVAQVAAEHSENLRARRRLNKS